jgi:hypothetical protein
MLKTIWIFRHASHVVVTSGLLIARDPWQRPSYSRLGPKTGPERCPCGQMEHCYVLSHQRLIIRGSTSARCCLICCHLQPTSTKACNQGACAVLVEGERIDSRLVRSVQYQGRNIMTTEGRRLRTISTRCTRPSRAGCFQCGYCTPGQICSAIGMAAEYEGGVPSALTTAFSPRFTLRCT